jgi:hypothetical protein
MTDTGRLPPKRVVGRPFPKGVSGNPGGGGGRARAALNAATIEAMHEAFRLGGRQAIDKVMKNSPAIFLKLLVLLVPRELQVEHTGGVKQMTDEAIEQAIEAIQGMLAQRADGANAKLIEGVAEPAAIPPPAKPKRVAKVKLTPRTPRIVQGEQAGGRPEDVSDS